MRQYYIDLTRGISGDMFVSSSYAYMNERMRKSFAEHISGMEESLGIRMSLKKTLLADLVGFMITWIVENETKKRNAKESTDFLQSVGKKLCLSDSAMRFAEDVLDDILRAESNAHNIPIGEVHLHEIGRETGLVNIAAAGLCMDILNMHERKIIGSFISIGAGTVDTAHGPLRVPVPAAVQLLRGVRFRFGPYNGEMATPTGIAIIKKALKSQSDALPQSSREGVGFGTRAFEGHRGYARLFEANSDEKEES